MLAALLGCFKPSDSQPKHGSDVSCLDTLPAASNGAVAVTTPSQGPIQSQLQHPGPAEVSVDALGSQAGSADHQGLLQLSNLMRELTSVDGNWVEQLHATTYLLRQFFRAELVNVAVLSSSGMTYVVLSESAADGWESRAADVHNVGRPVPVFQPSNQAPTSLQRLFQTDVMQQCSISGPMAVTSLPHDWQLLAGTLGATHFSAIPMFRGHTLLGALTVAYSATGGRGSMHPPAMLSNHGLPVPSKSLHGPTPAGAPSESDRPSATQTSVSAFSQLSAVPAPSMAATAAARTNTDRSLHLQGGSQHKGTAGQAPAAAPPSVTYSTGTLAQDAGILLVENSHTGLIAAPIINHLPAPGTHWIGSVVMGPDGVVVPARPASPPHPAEMALVASCLIPLFSSRDAMRLVDLLEDLSCTRDINTLVKVLSRECASLVYSKVHLMPHVRVALIRADRTAAAVFAEPTTLAREASARSIRSHASYASPGPLQDTPGGHMHMGAPRGKAGLAGEVHTRRRSSLMFRIQPDDLAQLMSAANASSEGCASGARHLLDHPRLTAPSRLVASGTASQQGLVQQQQHWMANMHPHAPMPVSLSTSCVVGTVLGPMSPAPVMVPMPVAAPSEAADGVRRETTGNLDLDVERLSGRSGATVHTGTGASAVAQVMALPQSQQQALRLLEMEGISVHGHSMALSGSLLGSALDKNCSIWISDCTLYMQDASHLVKDILSLGKLSSSYNSLVVTAPLLPSQQPLLGLYLAFSTSLPSDLLKRVAELADQMGQAVGHMVQSQLCGALAEEWHILHDEVLGQRGLMGERANTNHSSNSSNALAHHEGSLYHQPGCQQHAGRVQLQSAPTLAPQPHSPARQPPLHPHHQPHPHHLQQQQAHGPQDLDQQQPCLNPALAAAAEQGSTHGMAATAGGVQQQQHNSSTSASTGTGPGSWTPAVASASSVQSPPHHQRQALQVLPWGRANLMSMEGGAVVQPCSSSGQELPTFDMNIRAGVDSSTSPHSSSLRRWGGSDSHPRGPPSPLMPSLGGAPTPGSASRLAVVGGPEPPLDLRPAPSLSPSGSLLDLKLAAGMAPAAAGMGGASGLPPLGRQLERLRSVPRKNTSFTIEKSSGSGTGASLTPLVAGLHDKLRSMQTRLLHCSAQERIEELMGLELLEKIGEGGFGVVYRGIMSGVECALKVMLERTPLSPRPCPPAACLGGSLSPAAAGGAGNQHPHPACLHPHPAGAECDDEECLAASVSNQDMRDAFELAVMSSVSHPSIVQVLTFFTDVVMVPMARPTSNSERPNVLLMPAGLQGQEAGGTKAMVICMEYCDSGNLSDAISHGSFKEMVEGGYGRSVPHMASIYSSLLEVAMALRQLHSLNLVHCDLKPSNVLLKSSARDPRGFVCKLGDFGLVKMLVEDASGRLVIGRDHNSGTVTHMAPEVLRKRDDPGVVAGAPIDIYAFGVMMWELVTSRPVYPGMPSGRIRKEVAAGRLRPDFPPGVDTQYRALAEQCWHSDPEARPTASQLVATLNKLAVASGSLAHTKTLARKSTRAGSGLQPFPRPSLVKHRSKSYGVYGQGGFPVLDSKAPNYFPLHIL